MNVLKTMCKIIYYHNIKIIHNYLEQEPALKIRAVRLLRTSGYI